MEYYEEIVGKRRQSGVFAIVSLVLPLVLGTAICMIESKYNLEYNFYILDIFSYSSTLVMFYIFVKPVIKAVCTFNFKNLFIMLLLLGVLFGIVSIIDNKHTPLYNIKVPGLCENMEYALLYIFFSLLLFIVYLIKFAYYSILANKCTDKY